MPKNLMIKSLLKKHIWQYWEIDVAEAIKSKSLFSCVFFSNPSPPVFHYKIHIFLISMNKKVFPRPALSTVLRFWLTPNRKRKCQCDAETSNLVEHLLFSCPNTRSLMATYISTINPALASCLLPHSLHDFLCCISQNEKLLQNFNMIVGMFDYPLY